MPETTLRLDVDPVLIVDDEPMILQSFQLLLAHAGLRSVLAASASDALQHLEGGAPFSLALIDLVLPDVDGLELPFEARRFRPDLPLVAMSGYGQRLADSRLVGVTAAVVSKPVDRRELIATIESLLSADDPASLKES